MKILGNVTLTFGTSLLSSASTAIAGLVVAATLGPKGAGLFALARAVPILVALLLGLGIPIANAYLIGGERRPLPALVGTTLALGAGLGALAYGGWFLAATWLQGHFFATFPLGAVLVLGAAAPLQLLRNFLTSVLQGLKSFREANAVLFVEDVTGMLLVLPLTVHTGDGDAIIVLAAVAAPAMSLIAALWCLARRGLPLRPRLDASLAGTMVRFGLKGHVGRMANLLNWRLDLMMLSAMTSIEVVGYYAVATKVAELLRPLAGSLAFVLRPVMASLPPEEASARSVVLYRRVFLINVAGILALSFCSGTLITGFFGPQFAPAIGACNILLLGLVLQGGDGVLNGYHVGIGRPELNTYAALAGLLVTAGGNPLLIPAYSLTGAAIASAVAYVLRAAVLVVLFVRTSGLGVRALAGVPVKADHAPGGAAEPRSSTAVKAAMAAKQAT